MLNMNKGFFLAAVGLIFVALAPIAARAQTTYAEDFTKSSTANNWYYFGGACLTAGSTPGSSTPPTTAGQLPACLKLPYFTSLGDSTTTTGTYGGATGTLPDVSGSGALRFTNNFGQEHGAILSGFTFQTNLGLQVTFTTETYEGNSYANNSGAKDGADGMSFFLQSVDNNQLPGVGATGGSLGYTCSNTNNVNDGVIGGYVGLGIDEYGNFLNQSDNTSSGSSAGQVGNRIGMRGAGSTAWSYLNTAWPNYYPSSLTSAQRTLAVRATCSSGVVQDWSTATQTSQSTAYTNYQTANCEHSNPSKNPAQCSTPYSFVSNAVSPAITLPNYTIIANANTLFPTGTLVANEGAIYRGDGSAAESGSQYGVPITYNLKITAAGLLSLSYSYDGGVFLPVITNQNISASNGGLPSNVRFGFAGSTGGGTNIHEIMCFKAVPSDSAQSSVGVQKQSAQVQIGTQVYFAYYNPSTWAGSLTSQNLIVDPKNAANLLISSTANWDAACVLTGVTTCAATGASGPTTGQNYLTPAPGRVILTWNDATSLGTGFEWTNLSPAEQSALTDSADTIASTNRLNYLRGQRTYEAPSTGPTNADPYRSRTSLLGDIVDSSPTWVGPPSATYPTTWVDKLTGATMPENAVSYSSFVSSEQTRLNVVYAGANDGLLHGFESGKYTTAGAYDPTLNDGKEVIAYMPGAIVESIHKPDSSDAQDDFSNPLYGHDFYVDGTPTTGDMFYGGAWHTVLVGGLGAGGAAIYALDITDPTGGATGTISFSEGNATSLVLGEWTPANLSCANTTPAKSCGSSLGNTYGIPSIHRFHNGMWGFVFGNGLGSASGDAGVFVILKNPSTAGFTTYYLSSGSAGKSDGIAYATPTDLDGDQVTDYIYAGDVLGNVWRFDVTSSNPANWSAANPTAPTLAAKPIFTTDSGQPITTKVIVVAAAAAPNTHVIVEFGTGRVTPLSNTTPANYNTNQQALYGIWDWNMSAWDAMSSTLYATLYNPSSTTVRYPPGGLTQPTSAISTSEYPTSNSKATLLMQTITSQTVVSSTTETAAGFRTISSNPICYADTPSCTQFGWSLLLSRGPSDPTVPSSPVVAEQIVYSPLVSNGAFIVNTVVPPTNAPTACQSTLATGWTMALNPGTGGSLSSSVFADVNNNFVNTAGQTVSGVQLNGTGTPSIVTYVYSGKTEQFLITQTTTAGITSGTANNPTGYVPPPTTAPTPQITMVNLPGGSKGSRLTWIEKR
jgi:type IV pilus assembly protein PilY1